MGTSDCSFCRCFFGRKFYQQPHLLWPDLAVINLMANFVNDWIYGIQRLDLRLMMSDFLLVAQTHGQLNLSGLGNVT